MYDNYDGDCSNDERSSATTGSKHSSISSRKTKQRQRISKKEGEKGRAAEKEGTTKYAEKMRVNGEREEGEGKEQKGEKRWEKEQKRERGGIEQQKEPQKKKKQGTTTTKATRDSSKRLEEQWKKNTRRQNTGPTEGQKGPNSKMTVAAEVEQKEEGEEVNGTGETVPTAMTLRQNSFDHFSFTCHLFPRLSESNLQFHDIYWDRDPSTKFVTLRKRQVFVNKLVRSLRVRQIGAVPAENSLRRTEFRADFSLVDRRPFARREIVSNVFTVRVPFVSGGGGPRRIFRKVPSSASVLVRSNYRQRAVALKILLHRSTTTTNANAIDHSSLHLVGRVEMELLDENAKMALTNHSHSFVFDDGKVRLDFETTDVPNREQIQADSLPDVLICDESWLPMLAIYRQLICETLSEDGDVFADRSVWVVDPVMATFPPLLDTDADGVALLMALMRKFSVDNRELTPQAAARRFRFVYMHFILPLTALIDDRRWRETLWTFVRGRMEVEEPNPIKMFATEPCKAIDTFEYAVNLCGEHSID
ncbi:hypothetical protein niasHS_013117 [Heterodera schachtii]|uniref:Uncharacterized protein n=1 Tax=Heterodera schachtii TaxID=97005 RepID=A0ABD2ICW1_HETSC